MSERYDIAIVGSGPAGLSAALNAKIRNKKFIIFGNKNLTNKLVKAPKINNYLGFYGITGAGVKERFQEHLQAMDIEITEERINSIYAMGEYFALMANDKTFEAKSVILATGIEYTRPIKGEEEYLGKGVGYCATCDAPLYKGKVVTIIGHNKEAEEEANYVSELAGEVYYVPMYKGNYNLRNNIKVVEDKPQEIVGELKVNKLLLKNTEIETDAVFLLKDSISPGQLVPGLKIEENHIFVDRLMKTNIPGCFAAGDCVGKPYQYIKSAGEGNIAALSAVQYLDKI
ncbi:MAG: NAD(P)/FAD-dependent oxidoreductase [Clostridium sp.]|uniref:NAD(P)/FAD-dependent oxidoreductase n=1 Tax=Clostridium sp. TaxID=1506 RepID=UPI001EB52E26|nr:NAD(P)/FAD-dependent oxidoreductase [Clostridium sp.]MBS5885077.1 NAD(P)/FAD-dependent oxidoreductase [Clostridium sp.]MDU7148573.1 NAD(P)/FAD-dependent oxidoreductase [Clostridium sp.]